MNPTSRSHLLLSLRISTYGSRCADTVTSVITFVDAAGTEALDMREDGDGAGEGRATQRILEAASCDRSIAHLRELVSRMSAGGAYESPSGVDSLLGRVLTSVQVGGMRMGGGDSGGGLWGAPGK
ncbi:hypothetical protein HK101_006600, partial [Irineochytrium annulatum]